MNISNTSKPDFNGDGWTDILWQKDGVIAIWNMNQSGSTYLSTPIIQIPNNLKYIGYGDITHNGTSDMIFQDKVTGLVSTWDFTNNIPTIKTDLQLQTTKEIRDLGDYDGNGNIDLLWYTPPPSFFGGIPGVWTAGTAQDRKIPPAFLGDFPKTSLDYGLVGTGDFNGDGRDDVLFRGNGNAAAKSFLLQEPTGGIPSDNEMSVKTTIFSGPPADWKVISISDFNGDGKSDIFWHNDIGVHSIWLMDGTVQIGGGMLQIEPGPDWNAIAVQDYNNDGKSDIMWRNVSTGNLAEWGMNGNNVQNLSEVQFVNPGDSWTILG